jgi:hypothetical protein
LDKPKNVFKLSILLVLLLSIFISCYGGAKGVLEVVYPTKILMLSYGKSLFGILTIDVSITKYEFLK